MTRALNVIVICLALAVYAYMRYVDDTVYGDRIYDKWRDVKRILYLKYKANPLQCPSTANRAILRSADCPSVNAKGAQLWRSRYVARTTDEDTNASCSYKDNSTCHYASHRSQDYRLQASDPPDQGYCDLTAPQQTLPTATDDEFARVFTNMPEWDCMSESQNGSPLTMMILSRGTNVDFQGSDIMYQCGFGRQGCVYIANGTLNDNFSEVECRSLPKLCPGNAHNTTGLVDPKERRGAKPSLVLE